MARTCRCILDVLHAILLLYKYVPMVLGSIPFVDAADANSSQIQLTDEQRLYKKLMNNYDRNTRPVFNASHPVNVNISISLTQIFDVVSSHVISGDSVPLYLIKNWIQKVNDRLNTR